MPSVVEYPIVLADQTAAGLRSLYYNSGAFGFAPAVATTSVGWIGPPDETIRPAARPLVRQVGEPYPCKLAELLARAWVELLPGPTWVMPKSHWGYELDFGSKEWLPDALRAAGVDPSILAGRNNAAAVQFEPGEAKPFAALVEALLTRLKGSDFAAAWPGRRVACTIHSHQQLWWTTDDAAVAEGLDRLVVGQP
jgi:hypothetical protein